MFAKSVNDTGISMNTEDEDRPRPDNVPEDWVNIGGGTWVPPLIAKALGKGKKESSNLDASLT